MSTWSVLAVTLKCIALPLYGGHVGECPLTGYIMTKHSSNLLCSTMTSSESLSIPIVLMVSGHTCLLCEMLRLLYPVACNTLFMASLQTSHSAQTEADGSSFVICMSLHDVK